jgi:hypothetical protein
MAEFQQKPNTASLFKNSYKKQGDNQPSLKGKANFVCTGCGMSHDLDAAMWSPDPNTKRPYSMKFSEPRNKKPAPAPQQPAQAQPAEDDLPF